MVAVNIQMEWQGMFGDESDDEDTQRGETNQIETSGEEPICSVRSIEGIGGGRGVFAERDISPGTLILAEKPVYNWPVESSLSDPVALRRCVEDICSLPEILEMTKFLHPLSLSDAEPEEINKIQSFWNTPTSESEGNSKQIAPSKELIRVALVLQHNGFTSGLYKYLSLVNHSCLPNCIKFSPSISNKANWKYISEIWSIQPIKAGEEITICYIERIEIPYRTMRNYLLQNHQFLCNCIRCKGCEKRVDIEEESQSLPFVESILESLEASEVSFDVNQFPLQSEELITTDSKNPEEELEADVITRTLGIISYVHMIISSLSPSNHSEEQNSRVEGGGRSDLIQRDLYKYNPRDLTYLLCRFHQIIVSITVKLIDAYFLEKSEANATYAEGEEEEDVTRGVLSYLCECYIKHASELYELQSQYLSCPDHPLIGETIAHLAQGIKVALLHRDKDRSKGNKTTPQKQDVLEVLFSSDPVKYPWAKTVSLARAQMRELESLSARIDGLYKINYEMLQQHFTSQKRIFG
jgi:hypothetical protein